MLIVPETGARPLRPGMDEFDALTEGIEDIAGNR